MSTKKVRGSSLAGTHTANRKQGKIGGLQLMQVLDHKIVGMINADGTGLLTYSSHKNRHGQEMRFNLGWPTACGKLCLLYTSPSPRDRQKSRMPSSA